MSLRDGVGSATTESASLPRSQSGSERQRLLATLLGDYWFWRREHLPSSVLMRLLAEFGTSPTSARAAIRRLAERGVLARSHRGRTTSYGLPPRSHDALVEYAVRLLSFGAAAPTWDGMWTVVNFSIPEGGRNSRHALRTGLRGLGFAPLYDGVWVSPYDRGREAVMLLNDLKVMTATVMRASEVPGPPATKSPSSAFELRSVARAYDDFIARYKPVLESIVRGTLAPPEAFVRRTELMSEWNALRHLDPDLPAEMLPGDWPRQRARAIYVEIYDSLGPLGEQRFREIVGEISPRLAELATHHTSKRAVPAPSARNRGHFA